MSDDTDSPDAPEHAPPDDTPDSPDDTTDSTDDAQGEEVRTWLVERSYDSRNLVTLVYATPDGERALIRELSSSMLDRTPITAARDVDPDDLAPVEASNRERYRTEAQRVRENNDPGDEI